MTSPHRFAHCFVSASIPECYGVRLPAWIRRVRECCSTTARFHTTIWYWRLGLLTATLARISGKPFAPGLKRIEDATAIRGRLLSAFERAEATEDAEERQALLTFLIVGGGPTGVELAGAIAELARFGMEKDFRRFDPASARIILVQSGPRVLPAFDENLAAIAQRSLQRLGVEVLVGSRVEHIDALGVYSRG